MVPFRTGERRYKNQHHQLQDAPARPPGLHRHGDGHGSEDDRGAETDRFAASVKTQFRQRQALFRFQCIDRQGGGVWNRGADRRHRRAQARILRLGGGFSREVGQVSHSAGCRRIRGDRAMVPRQKADRGGPKRAAGSGSATASLMLKLLLVMFSAAKAGKILTTAGTMILSIGAYSLLYGWRYAIGLVL